MESCFICRIGNSGSAFMHCSMRCRSPRFLVVAIDASGPTYSIGSQSTPKMSQFGQMRASQFYLARIGD
jgi:hypothetical protein